MNPELSKMADDWLSAVKGFVAGKVDPLVERVTAIEQREPARAEKGDPGEKGDTGADGLPGADAEPGQKGEPGRDGREGEPGRDALQIEVLDGIDTAKRYQRGTFATWRGGIVRSFRPTDPIGADGIEKAGWQVVVEGLHEIVVDGAERGFTLRTVTTSGKAVDKAVTLPVMIYRGVLRDGQTYEQGDTVTWGGSIWHCNEGTSEKPMEGGKAWTLASKRGRDGKDGLQGQAGRARASVEGLT